MYLPLKVQSNNLRYYYAANNVKISDCLLNFNESEIVFVLVHHQIKN